MANIPAKKKIAALEEVPEEKAARGILHEAKRQIEALTTQRTTAIEGMKKALSNAKTSEQQSFMFRGQIMAYDDQIAALRKRHGLKEKIG